MYIGISINRNLDSEYLRELYGDLVKCQGDTYMEFWNIDD